MTRSRRRGKVVYWDDIPFTSEPSTMYGNDRFVQCHWGLSESSFAVRRRPGYWRVVSGLTFYGSVRARSATAWDIFNAKGRRVAWAKGLDGPAAGLALLAC
jgi:hypothetical protein